MESLLDESSAYKCSKARVYDDAYFDRRGHWGCTVEIRGFDLDTLEALAVSVLDTIGEIDGITDVNRSFNAGTLQREFILD